MKKKLLEAIKGLEDAQVALESAHFMSETLNEMYSDINKEDGLKVYEWDRCRKISDIELDYVTKADNYANSAFEILRSLLHESKTTEE